VTKSIADKVILLLDTA